MRQRQRHNVSKGRQQHSAAVQKVRCRAGQLLLLADQLASNWQQQIRFQQQQQQQ
jgi:hypothetical protein